MVTIDIARDFSVTPGARFKKDGDFSAEEFRENFLEQYFEDTENDEQITIILDGVEGYATSFLDAVFGTLASKYGADRVENKLKLISRESPLLIEEILKYIDEKRKRR